MAADFVLAMGKVHISELGAVFPKLLSSRKIGRDSVSPRALQHAKLRPTRPRRVPHVLSAQMWHWRGPMHLTSFY